MSGRPIRVGLVGASVDPEKSWGTRAHIPAITHLPDFQLTAVCTSRESTARETAAHFGVEAYWDVRHMAESPHVDLVVVSVRTPLHRELVLATLFGHKHVYCEWPLGATEEEAREITEATHRAGVLNMIGMQGSRNEAMAYARDLVADGYIGRLVSVTAKVATRTFGLEETRENAYLADVRNGATVLTIATGHALEAICHAVGELAEVAAVISNQYPHARVKGTGQIIPKTAPDQVLISGTLQRGAVISMHISGGASHAFAGPRIEINGTEGDLLLVSHEPVNIHRATLALYGARRGEPALKPLQVPAKYALQPPGLPDGPARNVAHNYAAFARAMREGARIENDFSYALQWHQRLAGIQRAADSGRRQILQ